METRLATAQIRLDTWAGIVRARAESGLSVRAYCEQNNISRNAYFYWLRKLRSAALEANASRFVELPSGTVRETACTAEPVTVEFGNARISVTDPDSRDTFAMIVEVLSHAQ